MSLGAVGAHTDEKSAGAAGSLTAQPPHIIYILTDDLGYNFPGYNHGEPGVMHTPTLDRLATEEGVRLTRATMYKYCSPSRGSLMTGRYPWSLVSARCNLIPSTIPEGVNLGYTFLPKHLAKANYSSIHIGKWHLGFHETDYTPVARGVSCKRGASAWTGPEANTFVCFVAMCLQFDESFGFLEGGCTLECEFRAVCVV